jgi:hypothetical protein
MLKRVVQKVRIVETERAFTRFLKNLPFFFNGYQTVCTFRRCTFSSFGGGTHGRAVSYDLHQSFQTLHAKLI